MRAHLSPSRLAAALGMALFVGFSLGCMNLNFGGRHEVVSPTIVEEGVQRGKAYAPYAQDVRVYYPQPYATPPNLEFEDDGKTQLIIMDQRADFFCVKNTQIGRDFSWKARGVLASNAKAPSGSGAAQASFGTPQTP
jgi:hypothetical protein